MQAIDTDRYGMPWPATRTATMRIRHYGWWSINPLGPVQISCRLISTKIWLFPLHGVTTHELESTGALPWKNSPNQLDIYIYIWSNRNSIAMELDIQANGNLSTGGLHSINPINYRPWNPRFKHIKTRNATVKPSLKSPINRMEKRPEKAVKAGLAQRTSAPGCLEGLGFDGLRNLEQRARKPGKTMFFFFYGKTDRVWWYVIGIWDLKDFCSLTWDFKGV